MLRKDAPAPLWLLSLAGFLVFADGRVITPLLPAIERDFHTSAGTAGLAATTYIAAYALFQLCYGPFGDRLGKVRVIRAALVVFAVGTGLCAAMPGLGSLLAMRAVTGVAAAAVVPMSLAYLGDTIALEKRQRAITIFLSWIVAGSAGSQVLGGLLAQVASWRAVFVIFAAVAAVPALLFQRVAADAPVLDAEGRSHVARYREVVSSAGRFYAVCIVEGFLFWGASAYLGAQLVDENGATYVEAGLLLGLMGLASVLTARSQGRRTGVGRERRRFGAGTLAYAAGTALVAGLGAAGGWWALWFAAAAVVLGVGVTSAHATLQTTATEVAPHARATATSLFSFSLQVGAAAGSALSGVVVDGPGYAWMWAGCAVLTAALGLVGPLALPRRTPPTPAS